MPRTEPGRQTALADRPAYAPPKLIVLVTVAEVTLAPKPMGSGDALRPSPVGSPIVP
jgi:hypothetical protein